MDFDSKKRSLPERIKLKDFSGIPFTLNTHISAWQELNSDDKKKNIVLLGIASGNIEKLPFVQNAINNKKKIFWLEAPETLKQITDNNIPTPVVNNYISQINLIDLDDLINDCSIFFYKPGLRLAPDFWDSILAKLSILLNPLSVNKDSKLAWLPGNEGQLLHKELVEALKNNGFSRIVSDLPQFPDSNNLEQIWQNKIPEFILSINFRGLDSEGKIFGLAQALNIPLAIWLVDNPWHLLSSIHYPWWKKAHIFVSDASFINPLRAANAHYVTHCPLAVAPHMWRKPLLNFNSKPLFIGRSVFPKHKEFFGALKMDEIIKEEVSLYSYLNGYYPDYHWWQKKFKEVPWPGKNGRIAGFYTDYYSTKNRAKWIKKALEKNIRIIGDPGWKDFFPEYEIEAPVDYYGKLPEIYQKSSSILNITSLLLPGSLNQRHFDTWAAGSLLLTDNTQGLNIFPSHLVSPILLNNTEELIPKFSYWEKHKTERKDLIFAWQEHLKLEHSYEHRIDFIRNVLSDDNK